MGYQLSPLLWKKVRRGLSAGRVQSVALRLVCEREREIQNFVPQEYWNFMAKFCSANQVQDSDNIFTAKLAKIDNQKVAVDSKEKADLIDWVRGQNSDGAFECLDELPIETGYGGLAISLWNDSDDYFVCDREELDEYMSQHNSIQMGGM